MKPLFVNQKEYAIQVGTPSGAGRMVQPGQGVEGDYFESSWRAGMPITKLTEEEAQKFDKKKVLMSISLNETTTQAEAAAPNIVPLQTTQSFEKPVTVSVQNETKLNRTLEDTVNQAAKEMGTAVPTAGELNKMSMEQLKELGVRYSIKPVGSRQDFIRQLKARLAS
jgi:hypothetical protein